MIIADATIWSSVLRAHGTSLKSLFSDLLHRGEVTAPGAVFAELLAESPDERSAERLRAWATEVHPVTETVHGWVAAGDLGTLLSSHGVILSFVDRYLVSLCLREECPLWSRNPRFEEVARIVPLQRYLPTGL